MASIANVFFWNVAQLLHVAVELSRRTECTAIHWPLFRMPGSSCSNPDGEFETCPSWGPVVDDARQSRPIFLKTRRADRFDHSASRRAKVRNVSTTGSQLLCSAIRCYRMIPIANASRVSPGLYCEWRQLWPPR